MGKGKWRFCRCMGQVSTIELTVWFFSSSFRRANDTKRLLEAVAENVECI